ncbi:MAG: hypothetical protein ACTH07_05740 [Microbacterium sp.]
MSILILILGFAIAVIVMPPALVERIQRTVRRTASALIKVIQNKANDAKKGAE